MFVIRNIKNSAIDALSKKILAVEFINELITDTWIETSGTYVPFTLTGSLAGPYPLLVDADTVIAYSESASKFVNKSNRFALSTSLLILSAPSFDRV